MSEYKDGEVIGLYWEWYADALYVKGHMSAVDAEAVLSKYYGPGGEAEGQGYEWHTPVAFYARWEFGGEDGGHTMAEYSEPGRGRFKIMRAAVKVIQ